MVLSSPLLSLSSSLSLSLATPLLYDYNTCIMVILPFPSEATI